MTARHAARPHTMTTTMRLLTAMIALGLFAACAPPPGMIATLTLLPGTPTPRRPTAYPSRTPSEPLATATALPLKCPPFSYDTSAPEDASMMIGRHYDVQHLPEAFQQPESGPVSEAENSGPMYRWVRVRWQGRALYWIERQVCQDTAGQGHWEVADALALPRLDPDLGEIETRNCFDGAQKLANVIAYGMLDTAQPGEQVVNVQSAWKMGIEDDTAAFSAISPGDVRCVAEE